jgi:hypothetical protein
MKAKNQALLTTGAVLLMGGAMVASKQIEKTRQHLALEYRRWHPITVNRDIADISLDMEEFRPLLTLGDTIEVRITPAPGGNNRGTEIAARLIVGNLDPTVQTPGSALHRLRVALRNTQWLLETGEILSPDKPSTTRKTLTSLPLQFATRRAREGGRL